MNREDFACFLRDTIKAYLEAGHWTPEDVYALTELLGVAEDCVATEWAAKQIMEVKHRELREYESPLRTRARAAPWCKVDA